MQYYYCPGCGNVFNGEFIKGTEWREACPIANCSGVAFEIDEEMIVAVDTLWKKGYMTEFCCAGHVFGTSLGGYIMFDECSVVSSTPRGWYKDGNTIRYDLHKGNPPIEQVKEIHRKIEALNKWCEELESFDEDELYGEYGAKCHESLQSKGGN